MHPLVLPKGATTLVKAAAFEVKLLRKPEYSRGAAGTANDRKCIEK